MDNLKHVLAGVHVVDLASSTALEGAELVRVAKSRNGNKPSMKRRWIFGGLCLILLAGWVVWFTRGSSDFSSPETTVTVVGRSRTPSRHEASEHESPPVFAVMGVVLDDEARGLEGAQVCATRLGLESPRCTESDETGAFRLAAIGPGSFAVVVSARGFVPLPGPDTRTHSRVVLTASNPLAELRLNMVPGGEEIRGVVEDRGGGPIEGAIVSMHGRDTRWWGRLVGAPFAVTDNDGAFTLWADTFEGATVSAEAEGYAGAAKVVTGKDRPLRLQFRLPPEAVIEGRVVDTDGAGLAGVAVLARDPRGPEREHEVARTLTGTDGSFRLGELSPGRYKPVLAGNQDWIGGARKTLLLRSGEMANEIEVVAMEGSTIRGVIQRDGDVCPNGELEMRDVSGAISTHHADEGGEIEARGLAVGPFDTIARCDPGGARSPTMTVAAGATGVVWSIPDERPIAELSGTVLTMDGQPAAGAKVWLEYEGGKGVQTRTGLRGEFAWADVPSGPATVLAEGRSEQGAAASAAITVGTGPATIRLLPAGTLRLRTATAKGEAVPHVRVAVEGPWGHKRVTTGDTGEAVLAGVAEGSVRVRALGESERLSSDVDEVAWTTGSVRKRETTTLTIIAAAPGGKISGRVQHVGGEAAADAQVMLSTATGRPFRSALADIDGRFEFHGLVEEHLYVLVGSEHSGLFARRGNIATGTMVELTLPSSRTVAGFFTTNTGEVPNVVWLELEELTTGVVISERSFSVDGRFEVVGVPPGSFRLRARSGVFTGELDVRVAELDVEDVQVRLVAAQ